MNIKENRTSSYLKMKKEPLRIFIYLSTPMVLPTHGLHLDSLLTEVVARELFGHELDRWQDQDKQEELPLPLEKTEGKDPVWKASIAFVSSLNREHQDFWVKRTNDEFAGYISSKVVWPAGVISDKASKPLVKEVTLEKATGPANNAASGGFKSYYENRNLVTTDYLLFHAYGNKKEVERLLLNLKGIGSKTGTGFGVITKVIVEETDIDYSLFTPEKKPSRYLPVEDFYPLTAQMVTSRIMPPYWSKRDSILCYTPVSPLPVWNLEEKSNQLSLEDIWFDEEDDE